MRISIPITLALAVFASNAFAQSATSSTTSASDLVGNWKVDLRPTPNAAPYFQEFVVSKVNTNGTFEGTFYGAPISEARINAAWGKVRIAFVTTDQSGPYNHSAVLHAGTLEGLTNSTGRNFLSYWSAVKK